MAREWTAPFKTTGRPEPSGPGTVRHTTSSSERDRSPAAQTGQHLDPSVALAADLGLQIQSAANLRIAEDAALALVPLLARDAVAPARIGSTRDGPIVALPIEACLRMDAERLTAIVRRAPGRIVLISHADLRQAVAGVISALPSDTLLHAALRYAAGAPNPPVEAAPNTGAPDRHAAEALALWLGLPFAASVTPLAPSTFATIVRARPEQACEIQGDTGPLLAFAPETSDLPAITALVAKRAALARRLVITDARAIRQADRQVTARIVRPQTARWDLGIPPDFTARHRLSPGQKLTGAALVAAASGLVVTAPLAIPAMLQAFVGAVLFGLACARGAATLAAAPATFEPPRRPLARQDLPRYSILIPLYREARSVKGLVAALKRLDYPADRLEVLFLIEDDDGATLAALAASALADWMRIVVVPPEGPRTKPKALNVGLSLATGELVTIFDAEDRPEPGQLRTAAETFAAGSPKLACLQARLAVDHARDTWITRMFAVEYACLFDVVLPWLAARGLLFPLGGTSNHFRRDVLVDLGGWDAFNVTEDADLGIRLARFDYEMTVIASTTWEEAPLDMRAWLRQRTRWLKGWMQTWLVHMREPGRFARTSTLTKMAAFQILILGSLMAVLAFPLCLVLIGTHLAGLLPVLPGETVAGRAAFGLNAAVFLAGFATTIALSLRAIRLRRLPVSALVLIGLPAYWLLMALALAAAAIDLCRRPHHWSKTSHGLARRPRLGRLLRAGPVKADAANLL